MNDRRGFNKGIDVTLLITGLALFLGIHLVPMVSSLRESLIQSLGKNGYRGSFAVISLAGFALIVMGKGDAPYVHVFAPAVWGRHATMTLMLLSCYCLAALYLPAALKRVTAHPMLWGTTFWAAGHLFANGDLASLLLFGGFLVYALADIASANARGARPKNPKVSPKVEVGVVVLTAVIYGGLLWLHPHAFGVSVLRG